MALIPASRLWNWEPGVDVGVIGGIDQYRPGGANQRTTLVDVTQAPYNADNTGETDASAAIQAAIDAVAGTGGVVYCPTGTYSIESSISVVWNQKNFTIRGDGPTLTKWETHGAASPLIIGQSFLTEDFPIGATGDHFRGDTVITFPNPSTYLAGNPNGGVGSVVMFTIKNNTDPDDLVVSVAGFERSRAFGAIITAVSSTTITIDRPLPFDLPASLTPYLLFDYHFIEKFGVEDLWMSGLDSTSVGQTGFNQCINSWFYNVKITDTENYLWGIDHSLNCEARRCEFRRRKAEGTNGAGVIMSRAWASLVEDNIITDIVPGFEINRSCVGNVIAYNFITSVSVFGTMGGAINTNHGPHNSFNLYEGNIGAKLQCDGYFGGASNETVYRNWLHGTDPETDSGGYCIQLNRFSRNYSVCCNTMGRAVIEPGALYTTYKYENIYLPIIEANPPFGGTDGDYDSHGAERICFVLGTPNIGNGGFLPYEPLEDPQSPNRFASPINGDWYGAWDGSPMVRRGAYNGATAYNCTVGGKDVVDRTANDGTGLGGGNSILNWIANNPAKDGLATWDDPGPSSADWLPISANSFQEIDYDVINTLVRKNNFNYSTNDVPAGEDPGADETPASLFRDSKPAYFGALAWPAFGPETAGTESYESIPAGYRFVNEEDPGGGGDSEVQVTTLNVTGILTVG